MPESSVYELQPNLVFKELKNGGVSAYSPLVATPYF